MITKLTNSGPTFVALVIWQADDGNGVGGFWSLLTWRGAFIGEVDPPPSHIGRAAVRCVLSGILAEATQEVG